MERGKAFSVLEGIGSDHSTGHNSWSVLRVSETVDMSNSAELAVVENPYVAVVSKKCRNLRKKLTQILKIEESRASGMVLNEDQLSLLGTRQNIQRQLQVSIFIFHNSF